MADLSKEKMQGLSQGLAAYSRGDSKLEDIFTPEALPVAIDFLRMWTDPSREFRLFTHGSSSCRLGFENEPVTITAISLDDNPEGELYIRA